MTAASEYAPELERDLQPASWLVFAAVGSYLLLYLVAGRVTSYWIEALSAVPVALVTARYGSSAGLFSLALSLPLNLALFALLGEPVARFFAPARLATTLTGLGAVLLASRLRQTLKVLAEQRELVERPRGIDPAVLRALMQQGWFAIAHLDPSEQVTQFHRSPGFPLDPPDGARTAKLDELLPPAGVRRVRRSIERLRQNGKSEPFVVQLCTSKGEIVDLEGHVGSGNGGFWLTLAQPQAAPVSPALPSTSEAIVAQLAAHHPDALYVRRMGDGELLFANPAAQELLATPAGAETPKGEASVHPSDRKRLSRLRDDPPSEGYEEEFRQLRADGTTRWYEERAIPLDTASGRLLLARVSDINRRRIAVDALRNSEHTFRHLIDYAVDAFYLIDSVGQIVDCNQGACVELDYTREELLRCTITDISPHFLPVEQADLRERLEEGEAIQFESTHRRKNGSTFPVEARATRLERGMEDLLLVVARNSSARPQAEREHRATLSVLEELAACRSSDELCAALPEKLASIFLYPIVTIERLDGARQEIEVVGSHGPIPRGTRTPVASSLSGRAAQTRTIRRAEEPFDPSRTGVQFLDRFEIKTIVCIPLLAAARLLGTICFADTHERDETSSLSATLQALAPTIASTLARFDAEEELDVAKTLLDAEQDATLVLRPDARIICATTRASHLFGQSIEWLRSASWFELEPNLDRRAFDLRVEGLRRGTSVSEHALRVQNGSARSVTTRWRSLDTERGRFVIVDVRPSTSQET